MARYEIRITERLSKTVLVDASSYQDAVQKAEEMYKKGDIVLSADDHIETDYKIILECDDKD